MMNLIAFYLLAVASCTVTCSLSEKEQTLRKLQEVMKDLDLLKTNVEADSLMLNTPTTYSESGCALSVLQCFRANLQTLPTSKKVLVRKITNSLKSEKIVKSVNSCSPGESPNALCQTCDSYPKKNTKEFIEELGSLLRKTYNGLK